MRLIDADALYIEIMDRGIDGLQLDDLSEIQQVIADAPTVDPVRRGKWKTVICDDGYGEYTLFECDQCGNQSAQKRNYCSNCGAKME